MNLGGSAFEEYAHGPGFKPQFTKKVEEKKDPKQEDKSWENMYHLI